MIKRLMLIICDICGAQGPNVDGEHRGPLMREAARYGWKTTEGGQHICGPCRTPKLPEPTPLKDKFPQEFVEQPDRSAHWTEARKKESAQ